MRRLHPCMVLQWMHELAEVLNGGLWCNLWRGCAEDASSIPLLPLRLTAQPPSDLMDALGDA